MVLRKSNQILAYPKASPCIAVRCFSLWVGFSYEKIMALQGWIQIHRKLLDSKVWQEKPYSRGQAWITMLLLANHKSQSVWIGDSLIECGRGQCIRSVESWGLLFGWSRQNVRTFFKLLEKLTMIKTEGLQKTTRITVYNYETYQNPQPTANQQLTNSQPTANQQLTTNNNDNNDNNENNDILYTLQDVLDVSCLIGIDTEKATAFYNHYNAQGWLLGNGLKITELSSAITRWRNNSYKFDKPGKKLTDKQIDDIIDKEYANDE